MAGYLNQIHDAHKNLTELFWSHEEPQKLAYRVREAIHAARWHNDYAQLANAGRHARICIEEGGVRVVWGVPLSPYGGPVTPPTKASSSTKTPDTSASITVPGNITVLEIVGTALGCEMHVNEIYFPEAKPTEEELYNLYVWARKHHWKVIDNLDRGVTLTKRVVDPMLEYTPSTEKT